MKIDLSAMTGTPGWQSIIAQKKALVDRYQKAKIDATSNQKVTVDHGKIAEALFREWLDKFLPKKYGVTSGRLVSQDLNAGDKLPHYDVIIYNQLESPVLWTEENPDSSDRGQVRAIPVEHIVSVLEIKSTLNEKHLKEGLNKIKELDWLLTAVDPPNELYKKFLPINFCSAVVFFELGVVKDANKLLSSIYSLQQESRGFMGTLVLYSDDERVDWTSTGRTLFLYKTHSQKLDPMHNNRKQADLFQAPLYVDPQDSKLGATFIWGSNNFFFFINEMLAVWNKSIGSNGQLPSLFGLHYYKNRQ